VRVDMAKGVLVVALTTDASTIATAVTATRHATQRCMLARNIDLSALRLAAITVVAMSDTADASYQNATAFGCLTARKSLRNRR